MLRSPGIFKIHSYCLSGAGRAALAVLVLTALSGCSRSDDGKANADAPVNGSAVQSHAQTARTETVGQAAKRLWDARVAENWAVVFEFQQFRQATDTTPAQFAAWSETNEPFVIKSYSIVNEVQEGDFGWVEVDYVTSVRQFPDVPPTRTRRTEKWERVDERWKLVPPTEISAYPAPPNSRDREAEKIVRARFEKAWEARVAQDWTTLYDMTDPADRANISEVHFAEAQDLTLFLSYDIHWIEVIGDTGRLHVAIEHKINDPNLTKLPPNVIVIDEPWVKRDGEWYLDLEKGSPGT